MDKVRAARAVWFGAIWLLAASGSARAETASAAPELTAEQAAKQHVYATISPEDERGFARMLPPKIGEWLATHPEDPQTFERYKLANRIRPTPQRKNIVLQPLGSLTDEQNKIIEALREYTEIFFQMPTRVAPPLELSVPRVELVRMVPMGHRHGVYDRQYDADKILDDLLAKKLPADAAVYLGITMVDLWSGDLHYVFGLGSMDQRVGVYSLCRYYPEFWGRTRQDGDEIVGLRRACKVLNHETGHMFGLGHCIFYRCSMNGSNSLAETDGAPIHYCPLCHRKLQWNVGFDAVKRYEALAAFYEKSKLTPEADWLATRIKNWKTVAAKEARVKEE